MQPLPPPKGRSAFSSTEARDSSVRRQDRSPPRATMTGPTSGPSVPQANNTSAGPRKRKHRGGKRRKNRRQSFAAPASEISAAQGNAEEMPIDPLVEAPTTSPPPFFRLRSGNVSNDSLASSTLLDHRDQPTLRARRESRLAPGPYGASHRTGFQPSNSHARSRSGDHRRRTKSRDAEPATEEDDEDDGEDANDKTPLMGTAIHHRSPERRNYGLFKTTSKPSRRSRASSKSSSKKKLNVLGSSYPGYDQEYDVNNPPSMPGSPEPQPFDHLDTPPFLARSPGSRRNLTKDALIDIDDLDDHIDSHPNSPAVRPAGLQRHQTIHLPVEGDVCFPGEVESEMGFEDYGQQQAQQARRRSRRRAWPQLWALDEWSQQEKEQRAETPGVKKISEPVLIEGRLRPKKRAWHRLDEDAPYRYTYFNEELESTIHSQTISGLVQPGGTFRDLFVPEPPLLEDSSTSEDEDDDVPTGTGQSIAGPRDSKVSVAKDGHSGNPRLSSMFSAEPRRSASRAPSLRVTSESPAQISRENTNQSLKENTQVSRENTMISRDDTLPHRMERQPKPKRYGPRPTFWLDIMSPTEQEMRVLCKAFGIHALTSEDIMVQEAREKVELFRHYYFINYRTFEQDPNSEDYLEPINMYVIVFRQGILTFHFSQIPHPANVRRRIRQLTDYLILSSDWISYAIIDDITDVYQPLIHNIEQEVDDIDELILRAFSVPDLSDSLMDNADNEKMSEAGGEKGPSGIDMLRRVGECRKKVMALYRLLGNKADVIKGFAKRCNEQWEVAPRSEIGLYLGDIQDHILTMTSNLSHYETLLSRAHSNYLAQVSIRMNERQEQTSDVLGKLTVIGTIVLPMNIICGMWGMNVQVPGQGVHNLNWFWSITAGLIIFALVCYFVCKKMYKIV